MLLSPYIFGPRMSRLCNNIKPPLATQQMTIGGSSYVSHFLHYICVFLQICFLMFILSFPIKEFVMQSSLLFIIVFFLAFATASQDSNSYSSLEAFDKSISQDTKLLAEVNNLDLSVADECSGQKTPNTRVLARNTKPRICNTNKTPPPWRWYQNPFKSSDELREYVTKTNIGGRNEYCMSITRGLFPVAVCESGNVDDRQVQGINWFPYRYFNLQKCKLGKKRCHDYVAELDSLKCAMN